MTTSKRAFLTMSTAQVSRRWADQSKDSLAVWGLGFAALIGCAVIASVVFGAVNGPTMRAEADAITDQDNNRVCSKLGIGPETSRYSECMAALNEVRASTAHRNAQSIL